MAKNLNRIKAVLADKQHTNKWLAEQLVKTPQQSASGVQTVVSPRWRPSCR